MRLRRRGLPWWIVALGPECDYDHVRVRAENIHIARMETFSQGHADTSDVHAILAIVGPFKRKPPLPNRSIA